MPRKGQELIIIHTTLASVYVAATQIILGASKVAALTNQSICVLWAVESKDTQPRLVQTFRLNSSKVHTPGVFHTLNDVEFQVKFSAQAPAVNSGQSSPEVAGVHGVWHRLHFAAPIVSLETAAPRVLTQSHHCKTR